jgi:hypothetical protein
MNPNTDWTGIPHTDRAASCITYREVRNVMVVEVTTAAIRGATVDGAFEVSDHPEPIVVHNDGLVRVEVKCLWYGRKPPTTWMHLTLQGKWKLVRSYSGPVVSDIGQ